MSTQSTAQEQRPAEGGEEGASRQENKAQGALQPPAFEPA